MRSKISALTLFLFASCLVPSLSFATPVPPIVTLTLQPGSGSPYTFVETGHKTLLDLSCLNDGRTVNSGESWTAYAINVEAAILDPTLLTTYNTGLTVTQLKEDAYLDSLYTSNTASVHNQEVQDAIWSILDNSNLSNPYSDVFTNLSTANNYQQEVDEVNMITAAQNTVETSAFYSEFTFYAPKTWGGSTQNDKYGGEPQQFLGYTTVTPEPSSLILLGTGLAGLAGAVRRRMKSTAHDNTEV